MFRMQFYNAARRGIEFQFTFEEWVVWWEKKLGCNWMKKRGRRKGQYQMARKGDKGPYAPWNVECKTTSENGNDRKIYGTQPYGEKLKISRLTAKQARKIFIVQNGCLQELSKLYGVSYETIHDIRLGRIWVQATHDLTVGSSCGCAKARTGCVKGFRCRSI